MGKNDRFQNEERKRGRPAGKNRIPLSAEERRARNAQYERERRTETAEAMSQLAGALGCDNTLSNAEILALAVQQLQTATRDPPDDILELRRCNAKLLQQIDDIEARMSTWEDRVDVRPKTNGGIKKNDKIKKSKTKKRIHVSKEILPPPNSAADLASTYEPTLNEATISHDQIIKAEPVQLTEVEPFQLENVSECPVLEWGIDEIIAEYL